MDRVQKDEDLVQKWIAVEKERLGRKRKKHKVLIKIEECTEESAKSQLAQAA